VRRRRRAMCSAAGTHFVSSSSFFCSSSICVGRANRGSQRRVEQRGASWAAIRARADGEPALALFRVAVLATLMRDVVTEPRLL
jgi:hypothetical protein